MEYLLHTCTCTAVGQIEQQRRERERERERENTSFIFSIHYLTCQNYLSLFPSPLSFSRVKRGRKPPPMYQLN